MNSQFAIFRILFGSYLTWHFLALIPYGTELFSHEGIISDVSLNPTFGIFPNPLYLWDSPNAVFLTLLTAVIASITFTIGYARRTSALILWFITTALFHRNNLTSNPSLPYLGLILMLSILIPPGEKFSVIKKNDDWFMPPWIIPVASFLLALGYSFSGWTKLFSPSWVDGSAISFVLQNPLSRPGFFRDLMLGLPDGFLSFLTWGALLAELLYLPLALHRKTRPWIWLALVGMHLGLILLIDFADLSLGMLMIHLFTFDPKWLKAKSPATVAFDADCLMCNRFLTFLAEEDSKELLSFKALPEDSEKVSMLVTRGDQTYQSSAAVIAIFETLGGHWKAAALVARMIPRPLRDWVYRRVANNRYRFGSKKSCLLPSPEVRRRLIKVGSVAAIFSIALLMAGCSFMERPPGGNHLNTSDSAFTEITRSDKERIQVGDVVAFHMSKEESLAHLKKGNIQKIPYRMFTFGHLALVVEQDGEKKLLQLAMKQAANTDDGLEYLDDKDWIAYRPTSEIDEERLQEFVTQALVNLSDPKKAYDYTGALGLHNRTTTPDTADEIASEYTCVTLIQSALHYAGHPTRSIHRNGYLEIVTPAQLIHSARLSPE